MESLKTQYTRIIKNELREMDRFRAQAEKNNSHDNVERYTRKITQLTQEVSCDTERFRQFCVQQEEILLHQQQTQHKSNQKAEDQKKKSDQFYDLENQERKRQRSLQHQMRKQWEWLCQQEQNLPDYIRSNLDRMPNNKGYIWKGIWYFGHQPEEDPQTLIMFEKQGGGDMLVHEIKDNSHYKIFSRAKNGHNILVSERQIRNKYD